MDKLFLNILNMSFTAIFLIFIVLIIRLFLKRISKIFSYGLWSVVLFRLLSPFSFESIYSILPINKNPINENIVFESKPTIDSGIKIMDEGVNNILPPATPYSSINPIQVWIFIGQIIWILGIVSLLIYSLFSLIKVIKLLKNSIHYEDNVYIVKNLDTAIVLGIIRPKIYIPKSLTMQEKEYIILHEKTHIQRFDHIIKILSFLALCLHWFNPLVWLAFFISEKDMEMSCDEKVIKIMGASIKKDYSASLLSLTTGRRIISGSPLAFGEGDIKDRIKNILNYKKPSFWAVIISLLLILISSLALLTNPVRSIKFIDGKSVHIDESSLDAVAYGRLISEDNTLEFSTGEVKDYVDFIKEIEIREKEITKSREGNEDNTHVLELSYDSNGEIYTYHFNFSYDFTKIWFDNSIKPSFVYEVENISEIKEFFEKQLGKEILSLKENIL